MATTVTKRPWQAPRVTSPNAADTLLLDREGATVRSVLVADLIVAILSDPPVLAAVFNSLPTSLPATSGVLWNNGGALSIS